jgi:hypothetical protein
MKILSLALVALCLSLAGCGDTIDGQALAAPEVVRFHDRLNASQFEEIYTAASSEFQASVPKEKIMALFGAIRRKLGKFKSAKEVNWNVRTFNLKTTAALVYESTYEEGSATETFSYQISSGKVELIGYNISSFDLMIK